MTRRALTTPRLAQVTALAGVACLIGGCPAAPGGGTPQTVSLAFDFNSGTLGWEADVVDFPRDQADNLNFIGEIRDLPPELSEPGTGLYLQSNNTPDDLFTFIKRRVGVEDGLRPNQAYRVTFTIVFASNAPSGCAGAGGSPGESVYLKAGASNTEPVRVSVGELGYVRLNLNIGNQGEGGADASLVGNISNGSDVGCGGNGTAPYISVERTHTPDTPVMTTDQGDLWLLIGTDSGFEGVTALYYQRIEVQLEPVTN
jgi:hypothetical protein